MSKFNIDGDPDKFQLASIVTKNSKTGITSNKRLLVIKRGHLYYYSNIPKSFTGQNFKMLQHFHELPKCSIQIINIIKINGFQPSSSYFSIEFAQKNMMERQDIRKTLVNQDFNFTPKNTIDLVTWQFTCDNQIIKQRWVSSLNSLKEHYLAEQAHMQKYFEQIQNGSNNVTPQQFKNSSFGSFSSNRSSLKVSPWRQSLINRKSYSIIDNKYGIQVKDGTPKSSSRIDFPQFLNKQKSQQVLSKNNYDFQLIIQQSPSKKWTDQKYKKQKSNPSSPRQKRQHSPSSSIRSMKNPSPVIVQQSQDENSIPPSPIKQENFHQQEVKGNEIKIFTNQVQNFKKQGNLYQQQRQYEQKLSFSSQNIIKDFTSRKSSQNEIFQHMQSSQIRQIPIKQSTTKSSQMLFKQKSQPEQKSYNEKENAQKKVDEYNIKILTQKQSKLSPQTQKSHVNQEEISQVSNNEVEQRIQGKEFYWLLGQSCKTSIKFNLRLQIQKELISHLQWFKQKASRFLEQWINDKTKKEYLQKKSQQSNKILNIQINNVFLKIGLLKTKNIVVNNGSKIQFNQDSIKNLKRQYKIYQNLFKLYVKKLKNDPNLKIRIPLCCYIQYKGVVCIAFQQIKQEKYIELADDNQWASQKSMLLEEGYKLEWFNFKVINNYLISYVKTTGKKLQKDDQILRQHLKTIMKIGSGEKNHNILFESPIDREFLQVARRQNASTSVQSLQRYVKGLKMAKNLQGQCPKQQIIQALQYCLYCKQLRKLYRSAQGQINETHFFNLIFKKDESTLKLLELSNIPINIKFSGQLYSFIEHYFGIVFDVDSKVYDAYLIQKEDTKQKRKSLFLSSTTHPIFRQLPINQLQIIQSFHKLHYYIDTKHHLALPALQKKKMIYRIKQQTLTIGQKLQILYDQAAFHYAQSDFINCIKKCKQYEQNSPYMFTKLFSIYLLMMKAYSEFSQSDFTATLKKATEMIQYNYGYQHSSLINLFSLAAFYYFKFAKQISSTNNKTKNFMPMGLRFMKKAQQMCIKHFGTNSKQNLDILLDFSKLYKNIDGNVGLRYLQEAKRLCESNQFLSNPENMTQIYLYQTDLHILLDDLTLAQVSLLKTLQLIQSKISFKNLKHLSKIEYQFGISSKKYNYCESAIQRLWGMSKIQKIQALEYAFKVASLETDLDQIQEMNLDNYQNKSSKQQILVQIQRQKSKYTSLIEMIMEWLQTKNNSFLTMLFFMIHHHQ